MAGKLKSGALVTDISVSAYNDMLDMLRWWKQTQRNGGQGSFSSDYNQGVFLCKNASGGDLPAFSVVGINGPLFTPTYNLQEFKNKTVLTASTPDADYHTKKFGVLLNPCSNNGIARVCVCGLTPVQLSVQSEDDTICGIADGYSTHLITGSGETPIFWKDSGTGTKWGLVFLGNSSGGFDRITGLTTAAVTGGNFYIDNVKVIKGANPLDDPDSTTETIPATNTMSWTAEIAKEARLEWNETEQRWECYQIDGCAGGA
jgi:hypothetical protein